MKVYPFLNRNPISSNFISHMVQMKEGGEVITPSIELSFISHMVQMKAIFLAIFSEGLISFISHMVQMKGHSAAKQGERHKLYIPHGSDESCPANLEISSDRRLLYIPHGSDESQQSGSLKNASVFFISHMVQMKVH